MVAPGPCYRCCLFRLFRGCDSFCCSGFALRLDHRLHGHLCLPHWGLLLGRRHRCLLRMHRLMVLHLRREQRKGLEVLDCPASSHLLEFQYSRGSLVNKGGLGLGLSIDPCHRFAVRTPWYKSYRDDRWPHNRGASLWAVCSIISRLLQSLYRLCSMVGRCFVRSTGTMDEMLSYR